MMVKSCAVILVLTIASYKCENESSSANVKRSIATEHSRAAVQNASKEKSGPSHQLKKELVRNTGTTNLKSRKNLRRLPRNNYDYFMMPQVVKTPEKIKPGQYADKTEKKTKNWNVPEILKNAMAPSDSKISWSFWETDDSESWPDDADDSQPPAEETTTSTTTTAAPVIKVVKGPVDIHKHYIYFKKAAPWPSPTMMPVEEIMPMMPEEMMQEMMKGMIPHELLMAHPPKKGISGILHKLAAVDPVTILVAGIIPASLILAAAIPSVMNKIMMNKVEATMMPPMMMMMPMMPTTAMSDTTTMASRSYDSHDPASISEILQAASQFGLQALKNPKCAKKKFCRFARRNLLSDTPQFQSAVRIATIVMEDSWLDALGVRDILQSLSLGTCDEDECGDPVEEENVTTQPTPV